MPNSKNYTTNLLEDEKRKKGLVDARAYREKIYRKNGYHVIFVHLYKERKKWKNYLVKRIMEIEEKRHDEVMKMLRSLQFQQTAQQFRTRMIA